MAECSTSSARPERSGRARLLVQVHEAIPALLRPPRVPTVLTRKEVADVLARMARGVLSPLDHTS